MTECDYCKILIDSDVYEEELGMCLDCSNAYWSHDYDYLERAMSSNDHIQLCRRTTTMSVVGDKV